MTGLGRVRAAVRMLIVPALVLCAGAPALAQTERPIETEARREETLRDAFEKATMQVVDATCMVTSAAGDELGYGFMVEPGYVFTAIDVVERVPGSFVVHARHGESRAELAGSSPAFGVALLRVHEGNAALVPLPLPQANQPAIGQWAISVGTSRAPLAVGVISAVNRRVESKASLGGVDVFGVLSDSRGPQRNYERVLQHDGGLPEGALGSVLVDSKGRVLGVNLASVYRGSSFAAGVADLRQLLPHLKEGRPGPKAPPNGFLGVTIGALETERRAPLGVEGAGAVVREVTPGSAADKGGMRVGDVFRSIDGRPIHHGEAVGLELRGKPPGTKILVVVNRDGKDTALEVILGTRPGE